ncbi:MAG: T9SS type A sorting domain-containing protein [Flavobacteriales bacterium]
MKTYSILLVLLFASVSSREQIITGNVNIAVECCSPFGGPYYADSLDIDADNIYEVKIQSMYGLDNLYYTIQGKNNTQMNYALPTVVGTPYPTNGWGSYGSGPSTPLGPTWTGWLPNSGYRYIGFRRINAPADTTYGWMKTDFKGNSSGPYDTVFVVQFAYNTVPNVPLTAGQITSVTETDANSKIEVYPNPASDLLNIKVLKNEIYTASVINSTGQIVLTAAGKTSLLQLDIRELSTGYYTVLITCPTGTIRSAFIKN